MLRSPGYGNLNSREGTEETFLPSEENFGNFYLHLRGNSIILNVCSLAKNMIFLRVFLFDIL